MNARTFDKLHEGKVAVVTGPLRFAKPRIYLPTVAPRAQITGRNAKNGARVKADLKRRASKRICRCRLARWSKSDRRRRQGIGRVDALVNAAGITDRGTIWDTKPELFDAMMAVESVRRSPDAGCDHSHEAQKTWARSSTSSPCRAMADRAYYRVLHVQGRSSADQKYGVSIMRHHIRVNGLTMAGWIRRGTAS
jgi:NAD(P)-dependent dehydrogenase (short-subunit alcohol dehydrogenase family)